MSGFLGSIGRLRAPRKSPGPESSSSTNTNSPSPSPTDPQPPNPSNSSSNMSHSHSHPHPSSSSSSSSSQNSNSDRNGNTNNPKQPLYLSQPFVKAALVKGSFKTIVAPPKYVDMNEWVGINIFDFFNNLNHFYGVLTDFCTVQNCPNMSAAAQLNFTWPDQNRRQVSLPAPTYIDYVMSWVQKLLDDEGVFPTKSGRDFQPSFPSTAKHIYKQLFRIFSHLYHAHFQEVLHLSLDAHFNSLFAHYVAFGKEYDLLDAGDLRDLRSRGGGVAMLAERWGEMSILEI